MVCCKVINHKCNSRKCRRFICELVVDSNASFASVIQALYDVPCNYDDIPAADKFRTVAEIWSANSQRCYWAVVSKATVVGRSFPRWTYWGLTGNAGPNVGWKCRTWKCGIGKCETEKWRTNLQNMVSLFNYQALYEYLVDTWPWKCAWLWNMFTCMN